MARKMKVRAPRVKMLARSAAVRGSLGGRPTKSGTKETRGNRRGKGDGSGRAIFV
jgi:hypothetical protein